MQNQFLSQIRCFSEYPVYVYIFNIEKCMEVVLDSKIIERTHL